MFGHFSSIVRIFILSAVLTIACTPQAAVGTPTPALTKEEIDQPEEAGETVNPSEGKIESPRDEIDRAVADEIIESSSDPDAENEEGLPVERPGLNMAPIDGATVLAQGTYLIYEDPNPRFLVIDDHESWMEFWQTYSPEGQTTLPAVNFDRSFVLIGIQGAKSTGGHSISFTAMEQRGNEVHVMTSLQEPTAEESVDMTFTQPYIVLEVESARLTAVDTLTFIFETTSGEELGRIVKQISG